MAEVNMEVEDDMEVEDHVNGILVMLSGRRPVERSNSHVVSKVPPRCRQQVQDVYTPCHVSIGPNHREPKHLIKENEKLSYLHQLLREDDERTRKQHLKKLLLGVKSELVKHDIEVRYLDVLRLVLDGCYLLAKFGNVRNESHITYKDPWWFDVVRDTWYLLENQIPFLVVKEIDRLTSVPNTDRDVCTVVFNRCAKNLLQQQFYICRDARQPDEVHTPRHLLHLLHQFLRPDGVGQNMAPVQNLPNGTSPGGQHVQSGLFTRCHDLLPQVLKKCRPTPAESPAGGPWHRATEYASNSNVVFVCRKLDGKKVRSVLDVTMHGNEVLVPCLNVDGNTWMILLNLLALEQQQPSLGTYVTAYCLFMSTIACTADDVNLLLRAGVIKSTYGDPTEVARRFAELCNGVNLDFYSQDKNYLKGTWEKLEKRYRNMWHNACSWLRLKYWSCRNMPTLIKVIVAFILLGSTVLSAVYAIYPYYHPRKKGN